MTARRSSRGFTLIELMIVVAIIGMLASMAVPNFQRVNLRAKESERGEVMRAIARAISEMQQNERRLPTQDGAWNPAVVPDRGRHPMIHAAAGWSELPLIVDAPTYYRYQFAINRAAWPATLVVLAQGDLDGDGFTSTRVMTFESRGEGFQLTDDTVMESPDAY